MTCCIVGLLIMMAVGRIRRALGGAPRGAPRDAEVVFAPVARRPAPGQTLAAPVIEPEPAPAGAAIFGYAAVGIALCLIVAPALVWTGVAVSTAPVQTWLVRSGLYLAVIVAAVLLGRTAAVLRAPPGAGSLLIVIGVIVFELGLIDMHLFRLFDITAGDLIGDMIFHNVGPALAMAGGLVLAYGAAGRTMTSRRSSRSTVTSARPASSAVTVSSTPPVTT
jgi:hypothetical protein